jgi:hypothetical protein
VPSVYVNVKGAVPVNVNVMFGNVPPAHIVPPPLTTAVGNGVIVTGIGEPKLVPVQLASLKAVTEYVPAAALLIVKVVDG